MMNQTSRSKIQNRDHAICQKKKIRKAIPRIYELLHVAARQSTPSICILNKYTVYVDTLFVLSSPKVSVTYDRYYISTHFSPDSSIYKTKRKNFINVHVTFMRCNNH